MEYESEMIEDDEEIPKKMIPMNLSKLSPNLEILMTLFRVNKDWIVGASKFSELSKSSEIDYSKLLIQMPDQKKEEYLKRLLEGEQNLRLKLINELEKTINGEDEKSEVGGSITLKELLNAVENAKENRENKEREEKEASRLLKLKTTEENKEKIQNDIVLNINRGTGKSYDDAMKGILDLKELAIHKDKKEEFLAWITKLKENMSGKPAMFRRLKEQQL